MPRPLQKDSSRQGEQRRVRHNDPSALNAGLRHFTGEETEGPEAGYVDTIRPINGIERIRQSLQKKREYLKEELKLVDKALSFIDSDTRVNELNDLLSRLGV